MCSYWKRAYGTIIVCIRVQICYEPNRLLSIHTYCQFVNPENTKGWNWMINWMINWPTSRRNWCLNRFSRRRNSAWIYLDSTDAMVAMATTSPCSVNNGNCKVPRYYPHSETEMAETPISLEVRYFKLCQADWSGSSVYLSGSWALRVCRLISRKRKQSAASKLVS